MRILEGLTVRCKALSNLYEAIKNINVKRARKLKDEVSICFSKLKVMKEMFLNTYVMQLTGKVYSSLEEQRTVVEFAKSLLESGDFIKLKNLIKNLLLVPTIKTMRYEEYEASRRFEIISHIAEDSISSIMSDTAKIEKYIG